VFIYISFTFCGGVVVVVVDDLEVVVDVAVNVYVAVIAVNVDAAGDVDSSLDVEELVVVEARLVVEVSSDVISAIAVSEKSVVENVGFSDVCVINGVVVSAI